MNNFKKREPYLSLVIFSRNDEHGGNMLERMRVSISGLLEQIEKYCIESELILVDWNPPSDKPLLKEIIKWPQKLRYCTIRVIEVAPSIHQRYKYSDKIAMNAVVAENCGIRRARGKFILPCMTDLLHSDELMSFIASKNLKENERYRADRCDVNRNVLQQNTLKEQLEYCKKNIIKIHRHQPYYGREGLPDLHTDAAGDFQLMSRDFWHLLRGYREADLGLTYIDGFLSYASWAAGVKEVILKSPICIYHIDHDGGFRDWMKVSRPPFEKLLSFFFNPLRPFLPMVISKKIVFLYHKIIAKRSKSYAYGIPILDYVEYLNLSRDIIAGKRSYIFNDENWGLGEEKLPEFVIKRAEWDKNDQ